MHTKNPSSPNSPPDANDGICMDCGGKISAERIKNLPKTTRCRTCQEAFEAKQADDKGESIIY